MDILGAAAFFDDTEVADTYTGLSLFHGLLDAYDLTVKDTAAGWRRTISTSDVVASSRGVVTIEGEIFMTGRVVMDVSHGAVLRKHLLLHPSDGLFLVGPVLTHLKTPNSLLSTHAALALRKESKEEEISSQLFGSFYIFLPRSEPVSRDYLVKSPDGDYYRVQNSEPQTGGLKSLVVSGLGANALTTIDYHTDGAYNSSTDTQASVETTNIPAFVERFQDNYRYRSQADTKFRAGDLVVTVAPADVPSPKPGDMVELAYGTFQVVSHQSDGYGAWELHVRP